MASGIAHDINNAISPVALYTESLLEHEPELSQRTRQYLEIIQRAIDDVAHTVSRMREFYRPLEPKTVMSRVHLANWCNRPSISLALGGATWLSNGELRSRSTRRSLPICRRSWALKVSSAMR